MGKASNKTNSTIDSKENASFQYLLLLGAFIVVLIWIIETQTGLAHYYDIIGYSVTLSVVAVCYWLARFGRNAKLAKSIVFFQIAIYLLAMVTVGFFRVANQGSLYPMASTLQWMPIVYIIAFLFLSKKLAVYSSLVIYALLVVLLILTYTPMFPASHLELNALMFNMVLAHGLYIVCMFSVIRLRRTTLRQQLRTQELEKEANLDALLGIANRRYLQKIMDRFDTDRQPVAVLLIDVDHFKSVNDQYGHSAGDTVLQQTVNCIKDSLRPVDVLGRWGGEEFLVLVDWTLAEDITNVAQRIQSAVQHYNFDPVEQVTLSIGVSKFTGEGEIQTALNQADKALYHAKENGRNQVVLFEDMQ